MPLGVQLIGRLDDDVGLIQGSRLAGASCRRRPSLNSDLENDVRILLLSPQHDRRCDRKNGGGRSGRRLGRHRACAVNRKPRAFPISPPGWRRRSAARSHSRCWPRTRARSTPQSSPLFGDPGLFAARELFDFPVIGVSRGSHADGMHAGKRFAVVTFSSSLVSWYRDYIEVNGMEDRCAGIHALDLSFAEVTSDQHGNSDSLVRFAEKGGGGKRCRCPDFHRRSAGRSRPS